MYFVREWQHNVVPKYSPHTPEQFLLKCKDFFCLGIAVLGQVSTLRFYCSRPVPYTLAEAGTGPHDSFSLHGMAPRFILLYS